MAEGDRYEREGRSGEVEKPQSVFAEVSGIPETLEPVW
jgi:hypothetical protein